jgi:hypothetical protein
MRNWETYVRDRLSLPGLAPAREARIIREIAAQLEDFYQDAIARGLGDAEADAFACAQVADWRGMAQDPGSSIAPMPGHGSSAPRPLLKTSPVTSEGDSE